MHVGSRIHKSLGDVLTENGIKVEIPRCSVFSAHSILAGNVNVFYNAGAYIWDIGPSALIIKEAGGGYSFPWESKRWDMEKRIIPSSIFFDNERNLATVLQYREKTEVR